jgi:cysteinyl-tRNA synthetase
MYNISMKIANTKWIKKNLIKIYCCGPTVYNKPHIGNLKPLITSSYIVNFLLLNKKEVLFVHNITDIDDKIVNIADEKNKSEEEIAQEYTSNYLNIINDLDIRKPDFMPNVTSNIKQIVDYIKELINKKSAYITKKGNVYFSVKNYNEYGKISNRILESSDASETDNDNDKKFNLDFALWKTTNKGIQWDYGIGKGRPGWHTECSYFIYDIFNNTADIHLGGADLKFPHHENENIQSIALVNKPITESWMHCGQLMVNNEKMSKSLNNFIYADEVLQDKGPNFIKIFFALNNYSKPLNFGEQEILQVNTLIQKIKNSFIKYISIFLSKVPDICDWIYPELNAQLMNDFNTSKIITALEQNLSLLNKEISKKDKEKSDYFLSNILYCFKILGIHYEINSIDHIILLLNEQKKYVDSKQYDKSDSIRKQLTNHVWVKI